MLLVFDTERDPLASQHLDDDLHFTTQAIHALMRVNTPQPPGCEQSSDVQNSDTVWISWIRRIHLLNERTRTSPEAVLLCTQHDCLIHPRCSGFTGFVLNVFFSSPVTFTITSALSSKFFIYFFLNTNFPSCTDHPHMTPNPVSGILSKHSLMSFTVMVVGYSLLVLSALLVIFIPTLILNLF